MYPLPCWYSAYPLYLTISDLQSVVCLSSENILRGLEGLLRTYYVFSPFITNMILDLTFDKPISLNLSFRRDITHPSMIRHLPYSLNIVYWMLGIIITWEQRIHLLFAPRHCFSYIDHFILSILKFYLLLKKQNYFWSLVQTTLLIQSTSISYCSLTFTWHLNDSLLSNK